MTHTTEPYALKNELKLVMAKDNMIFGSIRNFIGATFQSLVIDRESIALKKQKFYLIASSVYENKNIASKWVFV